MIRYFKEYYQLQSRYQQIAQNTGGFGFVSGIFIYWVGWGTLVGQFIKGGPIGQPREYAAWESLLVIIGLPVSLWAGMIAVAFLFVLLGKISSSDAVSLSIKFTYPRHWLKDAQDGAKSR